MKNYYKEAEEKRKKLEKVGAGERLQKDKKADDIQEEMSGKPEIDADVLKIRKKILEDMKKGK